MELMAYPERGYALLQLEVSFLPGNELLTAAKHGGFA
jgi:hypothetical protein